MPLGGRGESLSLFLSTIGANMTLIVRYPTKKDCREHIGKRLRYSEGMFPEYKRDGTLTVANRPHITGLGREWFGQVTMCDGKITQVK